MRRLVVSDVRRPSSTPVSASLHIYSLAQLRTHGEFTYHWREHLISGNWVKVKIEG